MNTEDDDYCTCDVGPFATCPVCERHAQSRALERRVMSTRKKQKYETQSAEDRIAEIKAGYR